MFVTLTPKWVVARLATKGRKAGVRNTVGSPTAWTGERKNGKRSIEETTVMTRRSALGAGREKMIPLLTYTTSLDVPADYLKKGCCSPSIAGLPSEYLATRGFHQVAYSR